MMLLYDVIISIDGAEVMAVLHPRNHVIADCVYQQRRDLATWRLGDDWRSVFEAVCSTMCSEWNWDRSICMCIYVLTVRACAPYRVCRDYVANVRVCVCRMLL